MLIGADDLPEELMRFDAADMLHPLVRSAGELREGVEPPGLGGVLVALDEDGDVLAIHGTQARLGGLAQQLCEGCEAKRILWLATGGPGRPHDQLTAEFREKYELSAQECGGRPR